MAKKPTEPSPSPPPSSNHGPAHDKAKTGAATDPSLLDTLSETEAEQLPSINKDKLKEHRDKKKNQGKTTPSGDKPPKP